MHALKRFPQLWFYVVTGNILPRSYVGKLLGICFIGTHVPLIALVIYVVARSDWRSSDMQASLLVVLIATLLGTACTLLAIRAMLAPVDVARVALMDYREHRTLPRLPRHYPDSAGQLLQEVDLTIERLDEVLADLAHQARTDPLTGVGNRRRVMERGREALAAAETRGAPLRVGIVDLDDFKGINDRFGHAAGDAVLVGVAEALRDAIGTRGTVGRLGGDEFCFVLEGSTAEEAVAVVEATRRSMARLGGELFPAGSVHASFGIAVAVAGEAFLQVLRRADMAVYSAKAQGRDRVEVG